MQNQQLLVENWCTHSGVGVVGGKTSELLMLPCSQCTCKVEVKGMCRCDEKSFSLCFSLAQNEGIWSFSSLPGSCTCLAQGTTQRISGKGWTGHRSTLLSPLLPLASGHAGEAPRQYYSPGIYPNPLKQSHPFTWAVQLRGIYWLQKRRFPQCFWERKTVTWQLPCAVTSLAARASCI